MGRVQAQGGGSSSSSSVLHFSHPHRLDLTARQVTDLIPPICAACTIPITSPTFYACRPCNFFLETTCSRLASRIQHPSHPIHVLTLLPSPAYPYFVCDACGNRGTSGFIYHCRTCEIDLHCLCAALPFVVSRPNLHFHRLDLVYSLPYNDSNGFSCDVCRGYGSSQWLYRCKPCEFDVHLNCATSGSNPPNRFQSLPSPNNPPPHQQVPIAAAVTSGIPVAAGGFQHSQSLSQRPNSDQNVQRPQVMYGIGGGLQQGPIYGQNIQRPQLEYYPQPAVYQPTRVDAFVNQVVDSAAQQVGQSLGQNLVNMVAGGNGVSDGGGDGGVFNRVESDYNGDGDRVVGEYTGGGNGVSDGGGDGGIFNRVESDYNGDGDRVVGEYTGGGNGVCDGGGDGGIFNRVESDYNGGGDRVVSEYTGGGNGVSDGGIFNRVESDYNGGGDRVGGEYTGGGDHSSGGGSCVEGNQVGVVDYNGGDDYVRGSDYGGGDDYDCDGSYD